MKRFALAIFAVALATTAAFADAPAPNPTFNFYANDGVIYSSTTNGTSSFANEGVDYGQGAPGLISYVTIGVKGSNFGWSIAPGVLGESSSNTAVPYFVDHAYAYINPTDGLTLEVGQGLNATVFNDVDARGTNNFKSAWQGAAVGGWYTVGDFSVGAIAHPGTSSNTTTSVLPVVGALAYAPKAFAVVAYGTNGTSNSQFDQVHVSATLTSVDNLTLNAGYNGNSLSSSTASAFYDGAVGYAFGPLNLAVTLVYWNPLGFTGTSNSYEYLLFKPNVSYTVSKQVTLSAYFLGDSSNSANYETLGQLAWTPVDNNTIKVSVWGDSNPTGTALNVAGGVGTGANPYSWLTYYGWTAVTPGYFNASVDYVFSY